MDLLHIKLALHISLPGGQVFFLRLQLLALFLYAALHVALLPFHPLHHLQATALLLESRAEFHESWAAAKPVRRSV